MKKPPVSLLLFICLTLFAQAQKSSATIAFIHVTVIDVKTGGAKPNMTVIVNGNRIAAVGKTSKTKIPANSQVINASGKYMIPGSMNK